MPNTFEAKSVVALVTKTAIFGLVLGGLFGAAAGNLAPTFFRHFIPWDQIEPVGIAMVLGAFGGVVCGGALGGFAVIIQLLFHLLGRGRGDASDRRSD